MASTLLMLASVFLVWADFSDFETISDGRTLESRIEKIRAIGDRDAFEVSQARAVTEILRESWIFLKRNESL